MEIIDNLDPTTALILLGTVSGTTELIKRIYDKDWRAVATIVAAAIVGTLVALASSINPLVGTVIGLAASGYVTIAQNLGKN